MTLSNMIKIKFRYIFAFTLISTIIVSTAYVLFVWITAERAAVGLVKDHIERLVTGSVLRSEEIFIQRELDQFTKSLGQTQSFALDLSVHRKNQLIAQAAAGRGMGLRVRELDTEITLPSGQSLIIRAKIDMSMQIIFALIASLALGLISNISLLLTFSFQQKAIESLVKPISIFSEDLELASSNLPKSLYNSRLTSVEANHISEIQSLLKSRSYLFHNLKELYSEQERNQFLKARAEIAAQVSHDIRSPLSAINLIASSIEQSSSEKGQLLKAAVKRINAIANDLLTAEKTLRCRVERVDISAVVSELIIQKQLEYANFESLTLSFDFSEPIHASCNSADIQRVVSNLINNAVEALNGQGVIQVLVQRAEQGSLIIVKDNGPGLPDEIQARLGQRGNTLESHEGTKGSGLGLYHAVQALEANHGSFKVESLKNRGTTCSLILPSA